MFLERIRLLVYEFMFCFSCVSLSDDYGGSPYLPSVRRGGLLIAVFHTFSRNYAFLLKNAVNFTRCGRELQCLDQSRKTKSLCFGSSGQRHR